MNLDPKKIEKLKIRYLKKIIILRKIIKEIDLFLNLEEWASCYTQLGLLGQLWTLGLVPMDVGLAHGWAGSGPLYESPFSTTHLGLNQNLSETKKITVSLSIEWGKKGHRSEKKIKFSDFYHWYEVSHERY